MTVPKADSWAKCARGRKMQITKTQVTDPSDLANKDVTEFSLKLPSSRVARPKMHLVSAEV